MYYLATPPVHFKDILELYGNNTNYGPIINYKLGFAAYRPKYFLGRARRLFYSHRTSTSEKNISFFITNLIECTILKICVLSTDCKCNYMNTAVIIAHTMNTVVIIAHTMNTNDYI